MFERNPLVRNCCSLESLENRALFSASVNYVYISNLNPTAVSNGYGSIGIDQSNGESDANDGQSINLKRTKYTKGLGVHSPSDITFNLAGQYANFVSDVGIDHETGPNGSAVFEVYGDNDTLLFRSSTLRGNGSIKRVNVDVTGMQSLRLVVTDGGDGIDDDHADWAGARLIKASDSLDGPGDVTLFSPDSSGKLTGLSKLPFYGIGGFSDNGNLPSAGDYSYSINYGDGSALDTGTTQRLYFVNHTFAKSGTYIVTTTITSPDGHTGSGTNTVTIANPTYKYLSDLDTVAGSGEFSKDINAANDRPMKINGTKYTKGLGVEGDSELTFNLDAKSDWLIADVGIDDAAGASGSATFQVYTDNTLAFESGPMTGLDAFKKLKLNVHGIHTLKLVVLTTDDSDSTFADWAGIRVT